MKKILITPSITGINMPTGFMIKPLKRQKVALKLPLKRSFSNIKTTEVEVFEFERHGWTKLVNSALDRVDYNKEFWDNYSVDPAIERIFD